MKPAVPVLVFVSWRAHRAGWTKYHAVAQGVLLCGNPIPDGARLHTREETPPESGLCRSCLEKAQSIVQPSTITRSAR